MSSDQLSAIELQRLRAMLDRAEIDELQNTYFHAMDVRDFSLLSQVFTPDVRYVASLVGQPPYTFNGFAEVEASIHHVAAFRSSHHGWRNRRVVIDGDEASAVWVAIDALLDTADRPGDTVAGGRLIQHGLRYTDKLVRTAEGWRIRERHLVCLWQQVTVNPAVMDPFPF